MEASSLQTGQEVYARYQDGWYLAHVTSTKGACVDVAWLRPQGAVWGDKAKMSQYLCSTNADETLHGDNLPISSHIRPTITRRGLFVRMPGWPRLRSTSWDEQNDEESHEKQ